MRLVARFVVLLVALSILFDLIGQISLCSILSWHFMKMPLFGCLPLGIDALIERLKEGSLASLLWHYLPAIVVSLSIAIAWTLNDFRRKAHMNRAPLPLLPRLALRSAVLLFVLALYDFSIPLSYCFDPRPPILPETVPICFLKYFEGFTNFESPDNFFVGHLGVLPALAWHYFPVVGVAAIVMIIWAWKDNQGRQQ